MCKENFIGVAFMSEELKKYLEKLSCRGCYNHCSLAHPGCGRSKVFIAEATEKFQKNNEQDNFGTNSFIK